MERTKPASDSAAAATGQDSVSSGRHRTAVEVVFLVVLAVVVLFAGVFVGVMGPLLAIACDSCQDGIRGPLRFEDAMLVVAWYVVPLTTLGTLIGMFFPEGGAKVGGIGLGVLMILLLVITALGRFTT